MYDHDGDGDDTEFDRRDSAFEARDLARALRFGSHAVEAGSVPAFVEGGHATFTLANARSGGRYTYKVAAPSRPREGSVRFFVSVLDGPDNTSDYAYLGCVYANGTFRHGGKSRLAADAPSVLGFGWFWRNRDRLAEHPHVSVHHMGYCSICGRALTTPESISTGVGPVCAKKLRG